MNYSIVLDIMYLKFGPTGPVWPDTELLMEAMDFVKENRFDAVEFWDWHTRDIKALKEKLDANGQTLVSICCKDRQIFGDPDARDTLIDNFRQTVEAAHYLGCKNIIIANPACKEGMSFEDTRAEVVAALKELAPIAESGDVTIILEPVSGGAFFKDSALPFAILDEVGSPNVKLLYDCYHYQAMEGNICNTIKNNLDKIGHIHIAGCPMRCELGVGELDCRYVLNYIKELGYTGYVGVEFPTRQDREGQVARSRALLNEIA